MTQEQHRQYLLQALEAAETRRGFCAPNPAVGAVVVKDGQVLAVGAHWAAGFPHAEVAAFNQLTPEQSVGSTVYVTLEPCCHYGRTPPCVQLLIQRKVRAVYYGYHDPNPLVAGKGEQQLREAGIACDFVPLPEIAAFYQSYDYWTRTQLPFVTAKLALSLDGKIAGAKGAARVIITGPELQAVTHRWRKRSDALLTTSETIIADDPQLNARLGSEVYAKPVYILDSKLKLPLSAKIITTAAKVTLLHGQSVDNERLKKIQLTGVNCVQIPLKNDKLVLSAILKYIGNEGIHDLWVEAGGACFQALLRENLLQRAFIYSALQWLGADAQPAFSEPIDFTSAKTIHWQGVGKDAMCELTFG